MTDEIDAGTPIIEEIMENVPTDIPDNNEPQPTPQPQRPQMPEMNEQEKLIYQLNQTRQKMYDPTSMKDIEYMLNNKVKVITYDELANINDINDLLRPYMSCVILYPNLHNPQTGHWCCIFLSNSGERLEFFDSYGSYIDEKIQDYDNEVDELRDVFHKPKKIPTKLLELVYNSPYQNVFFNHVPYQAQKIDTATCGLWCVMRLKNKHYTEDQFQKIFYDYPISEGFYPDMVLSLIIDELFPEMAPQIM